MKKILILFFCVFSAFSFAQTQIKEAPIKAVQRIFKNYIRSSEHSESLENKEAMKKALVALQTSNKESDLPLLINVWLYYDVTDFFAQEQVEPIFFQNKAAAIKAIDYRIQHKKKWENPDTAPFSDLFALKKRLSS